MPRRRFAFAPVLFLALALHPALAHPAFAAPDLPLILDGNEGTAVTDDARALLFNPAAVGLRYPLELYERQQGLRWGTATNRTLLTMGGAGAYVLSDRWRTQTYGVALAFGGERFRFGVSPYRIEHATMSGGHTSDWRIGALSRPTPWLSGGLTVDRLLQHAFRGEARPREGTLGIGLRPLALVRGQSAGWGTRLTLSGDVRLDAGERWRQALVWGGAEFEPVPGLALSATLAGHREVRLGVVLRGRLWAIHGGSAGERGERHSGFGAVSVHKGEERTTFVALRERRMAVVHAGGVLADEAIGGVSLTGGDATTSAAPLHRQLQRALEDPLTRGVFLDLHHVGGMAQLEELRPRLAALRAAGKPVTAYLEEGGGRADLYLASACDRVVASEEGDFLALGLRSERRYWRDAFARVGLRVERSSTGIYKSAYRNLSVNAMPAADSEVVLRDLDTRQRLFVDAVSASRHLAPGRLQPLLDGRAWSAGDLAAAGVIDSVGYREDALRIAGRLAGLGDKPRVVDLRHAPPARREWTRRSPVAVVYAGGGIELGRSGNDLLTGPTLGSTTLIRQLERAFRAPGVRVVVFRIESPGGSSLASNLIDHAIQKLRRETHKPLIVSMGSLAGSGGYYIACHADRIYADRHTRTGAIGVLTVQPSFEGLYDKLHAHQEEFDRGDYMRGNSWSRDWTPREQAAADSTILRLYRGFVAKVADGRHMTPEAAHAVAQGRVWMGDDAHERGLVDAIGGLDDALREARTRAGVPAGEKIRLLELGRPRGSFAERLLGGWVRETLAREAQMPTFGSARMVDPEALGISN